MITCPDCWLIQPCDCDPDAPRQWTGGALDATVLGLTRKPLNLAARRWPHAPVRPPRKGFPEEVRPQPGNDFAVLADELRTLATYWPDLEHDVALIRSASSGRAGSGSGLPGGTDAISLLAEGASTIATWCLTVIDGRNFAGRVADDTMRRIEWLRTHAEWLERDSPEAAAEFADLVARVKALVAPDGKRWISVGYLCPVVDCAGGSLRAKPDDEVIVCDLDRTHRWERVEYRRLAALLGVDGPSRMTIMEWVQWAQDKGQRVTHQAVRRWTVRYPVSTGWDGETVDRVRTMEHWLGERSRRASA